MRFGSSRPLGSLAAAIVGLGIWRYQLIAKRRYEIAEQALTVVNAAVIALYRIRRAKADSEAIASLNPEGLNAEPWMATQFALQGSDADFTNLDSASKLIAMHFGDKTAQPFLDLQEIHRDMWAAQRGLYHRRPAQRVYPTPDEKRQLDEWKRALSQQADDDVITQRIDALDRTIKSRFAKHLRPSIWRLFLPSWE
jgi:hypothetical protein